MEFLNHLDDQALIDKSARHFLDALSERRQRNDIDYHGKGLYFLCLVIQNNWVVLNLLTISTWVYIFLVFIEPAQLHDINSIDLDMYKIAKDVETAVLCVFACNFVLEALLLVSMYRYSSAIVHKNKGWFSKAFTIFLVENSLTTVTLLIDLVFFVDFPIYVLRFPYDFFRFSRLLRPGRRLLTSEDDHAQRQDAKDHARLHQHPAQGKLG